MRERRDELGLTQSQIADAIGIASVTKDYVSRWERGVVEPSEAYLDGAAAALKTTVADLMAGPTADREATNGPTPELFGGADDTDLTQLDRIEKRQQEILSEMAAIRLALASPSRSRRQSPPQSQPGTEATGS
jgi:transcriptional regulator with XRE-family HTH domain